MARLPLVVKYCNVWRVGASGSIEGVDEALAFERDLLDAVDFVGQLDAGDVVDGRRDIVDVRELAAYRRS
jgi:hypothetical protein